MSRVKLKFVTLLATVPILHGTISKAYARCGKKNCVCMSKSPKLHGPYYRWTGLINGKPTTRTISHKLAEEYKIWIKNYRTFQKKVKSLIDDSLKIAFWSQKKA